VVDGGQQMERLLAASETVMLHAANEVLVRVGDASAVSLLINNQPTKPLGGSGEVVTRLITRANYSTLLRPE
jgi:spore germination protein GerM